MLSDIYVRLLLELMSNDDNINPLCDVKLEHATSHLSSVRQFYQLVVSVFQQCPQSNIGLEFGRHIQPINGCDFSRLITTSNTVSHALQTLVRYYPRLNLMPFPLLYDNKKVISISLCFPYEKPIDPNHKRFCSETFYRFCFNIMSYLTYEKIKPLALYLDYPKPNYAQQYSDVFGCEIHFNAPLSQVVFDGAVSSLPLVSANPYLHEIYLAKENESWQQDKRHQRFFYRTLSQLLQDFPASFNGQHLADALNISPRGLQKRLSSEGRSYSSICQTVRRELIKVCLYQRHYNVDEIAHCLGFQSQASFRKFFKAQFGMNPERYGVESKVMATHL